MKDKLTVWDVFSFACTMILIGSAVMILIWIHGEYKLNMRDCCRGGYEGYASLAIDDSYACIGVVDGELQIESLDTVRARLGEN